MQKDFRYIASVRDPRRHNILLLQNADGEFTGSFVDIAKQIQISEETGWPVAFESFPVKRSDEYIYIDLHEGELGRILDQVTRDVIVSLRDDETRSKIKQSKYPKKEDWEKWSERVSRAAMDGLTSSNAFFRYRIKVDLKTGEPNGTVKAQYLTDLDEDLLKQVKRKDYAEDKFKYVCNCEDFSILVGIIRAQVEQDLLGDKAGKIFYTIASSNYRGAKAGRLEHAMIMTVKNVSMREGVLPIVHFVDPSRYDLSKDKRDRAMVVISDRPVALYDIVSGRPYTATDKSGYQLYYSIGQSLPPPEPSLAAAPAVKPEP